MMVFGGVTKTYKSYGKTSSNTRNYSSWGHRASPPPLPVKLASATLSLTLSSDASSDDDDTQGEEEDQNDEDSMPPCSPSTRRRLKVKATRSAALLTLKVARTKQQRLRVPEKAQKKTEDGSHADKENRDSCACESPRRPIFVRARARLVVHSPASSTSSNGKGGRLLKEKGKAKCDSSPEDSVSVERPSRPRSNMVSPTLSRLHRPTPLRQTSRHNIPSTDSERDSAIEPPCLRSSQRSLCPHGGTTWSQPQLSDEESVIEPSRTESPESIRKRQGVTPEVGFSIIIPHIPRTSLRSVNTQRHGSEVSPPPAPIPEILISHQQMVKDTRVDAVELLRFQSRSEEGEEAEHEQAVFQRQLQEALDLSILDTKLNSSESTPPNVSPSWTSSGTLFPTLTQEIFPQSLLPLLSISGHPAAALDFTSFVRHPPSPFALAADVHEASWDKIGEASYSEVFRSWGKNGEELVIKIIPISDGTELAREDGELPYLSEYAAVMREIEVGKLLGGSDDNGNEGFVRFEG